MILLAKDDHAQKKMTDDELKQMQRIQLEMLIEFDQICKRHNIRYIIASGTLLGAVRYKGFIPWDDDIDVEMLRIDYEKLRGVDPGEFPETMFFQDHTTDKGYPWLYGKLRRNGTKAVRVGQAHMQMHQGVFVDIFPRDGVPKGKTAKRLYNAITVPIRKILYARQARKSARTAAARLAWSLVCLIPRVVPYAMAGALVRLFPEERCERVRCIGYHGRYEDDAYQREWFTELTKLPFEGRDYPAPADWDGYLSFVYGADYMTPPPPEKRDISSPLCNYKLT